MVTNRKAAPCPLVDMLSACDGPYLDGLLEYAAQQDQARFMKYFANCLLELALITAVSI